MADEKIRVLVLHASPLATAHHLNITTDRIPWLNPDAMKTALEAEMSGDTAFELLPFHGDLRQGTLATKIVNFRPHFLFLLSHGEHYGALDQEKKACDSYLIWTGEGGKGVDVSMRGVCETLNVALRYAKDLQAVMLYACNSAQIVDFAKSGGYPQLASRFVVGCTGKPGYHLTLVDHARSFCSTLKLFLVKEERYMAIRQALECAHTDAFREHYPERDDSLSPERILESKPSPSSKDEAPSSTGLPPSRAHLALSTLTLEQRGKIADQLFKSWAPLADHFTLKKNQVESNALGGTGPADLARSVVDLLYKRAITLGELATALKEIERSELIELLS